MMKRSLVIFGLVGAVTASAQVQLKAYQGKEAIGDAVHTFKIDESGNKITDTRFSLSSGELKVVLTITSTVDGTGMPVRRIQKLTIGTQPPVTTIIDFKSNFASVVIDQRSGRKVTNYFAPKGVDMRDPSEFWFVRDRPAPGTTVKFAGFSSDSMKWENIETTYVGKKTLNVGGLPVTGYEVRISREGSANSGGSKVSTYILDEKGLLLYVSEPSGMRLERLKL